MTAEEDTVLASVHTHLALCLKEEGGREGRREGEKEEGERMEGRREEKGGRRGIRGEEIIR